MLPNTHEIEIKAKIDDITFVRKKLEDLGCTFSKPILQKDTIYIPTGVSFENLIPGTSVLRIREINNKAIFTLKQRRKDKDELIKLEKEVTVSDAATMADIIELLDYSPAVTVNKQRTSCSYQSFEVNIDEVEKLGDYIEIESISDGNPEEIQHEMLHFLLSLSIPESAIERKGYDTLMMQLERE